MTHTQMTIDTYSHVAPGIQEAAAESFDEILLSMEGLSNVRTSTV